MPKFNMYQSLHTTVIGPQGKPVELQIRTFAHAPHAPSTASPRTGSTRRTGRAGVDTDRPRRPRRHDLGAAAPGLAERVRRTRASSWSRCASRSTAPRCTCSPRRGDVIALPTGATPVDFAYAVHTEVGHRTIGARVNGQSGAARVGARRTATWSRSSPRSRPNAGPSRDWLGFVKSPRARSKIRQWFTKERREEAIEPGQGADRQA